MLLWPEHGAACDLAIALLGSLGVITHEMSPWGHFGPEGRRGRHISQSLVRCFQSIVSRPVRRRTVSVRCYLSFQLIDTELNWLSQAVLLDQREKCAQRAHELRSGIAMVRSTR